MTRSGILVAQSVPIRRTDDVRLDCEEGKTVRCQIKRWQSFSVT